MVIQVPRHKVFVSFHNDDMVYKNRFVRMLGDDIVDKSVNVDDIDDSTPIKVDTIRRIIRDDYIADATVTVVLIGPCTWQRKHVDWEIGSSLRDTRNNSRCGLLGIFLPDHPDYGPRPYNRRLVPPRLADNSGSGDDPYALLYDWPGRDSQVALQIRRWIDRAFNRRKGPSPNNGRMQFKRNRSGLCSAGWKD